MRIFFTLFLLGVSFLSFSQRYAVANTAWNLTSTWSTTPNGAGGASVPTATDDAYTNGRTITVTANATCKNLFVTYNLANSITINSLRTLTITGTLTGFDDSVPAEEFPITNVMTFVGTGAITFTGANMDVGYAPYVIYGWDATVPFGRTNFTFGANSFNILAPIAFGATTATVVSGTLTMDPGASLSGATATLAVNSGATISTDDPIGSFNSIICAGSIGTTSTISSNNLTINSPGIITTSSTMTLANNLTISLGGTLNSSAGITTVNSSISGAISTSSFLNTSGSFTMGSTGVLTTTFNGGTQTTGWWSNSNSPGGSISLDPASTINFSATANQNIPILTFGNLTVSGSGTKTVAGSGTLTITGTLTNGSSSASFNVPTQDVLFTGAAATQNISGSGSISFLSGLEIDKSAGTVTLNRAVTVATGVAITNGTFNLGSQTLTLSSGNISNNATFTPATSTVVIDGATSITGSNPVSFNNLTIGASGTFTAPSTTLNISGNLTNNGSTSAFNSNSGTLLFNGTIDQSINGTLTVNNLTASNSGSNGVGIAGTTNLLGVFNLTSGLFDADGISSTSGVFVVRSTALGQGGRIGALGAPSNFTGNVTVERYIDAPEDYRYLSMPITNGNLGMWHDDFAITGSFSNATTPGQNPNVVSQTSPSVFTFNGATQTYTAVNNAGATSATPLSNTLGYVAWGYNSTDFVIDVTGTIGKGSTPISGLAAGQYNLIPNPYPSAIDWDNVTNTGFSNDIYLTTAQGSFATYNKGTGIGVNHPDAGWAGQVALGQSFWVLSTGGTSITFTETAKTSTYEFVREASPIDHFKIKLISASQQSDELGITFKEGLTLDKDVDFDAPKRLNDGLLNFSSYINNPSEDFAIIALPLIQCSQNVKLKFSGVSNGQYTIRFSDFDKLGLGYLVKLKDNFLNQEKNVEDGFEYTFDVTANAASKSDTRFEIMLSSPQIDVTIDHQLSSTQECNQQFVKIDLNNTQPGVRYLLKLNDESLHTPVEGNGSGTTVFVNKSSLEYGSNKLSMVASTLDGCNAHIFNDAMVVNLYEIDDITSVSAGQSCGVGSVTLKAEGSSSSGSYKWYESENAVEPIEGINTNIFTTPVLTASKTYYASVINEAGCESFTRTPVEAKIVGPSEISEITQVTGDQSCGKGSVTLSAVGAPSSGSYKWYESENALESIEGTTTSTFTTPVLEANKTYYVTAINATGCESISRVPVEAEVVYVPKPNIVANGNTLSVENESGVQWLKDGTPIEGATAQEYEVKNSGVYTVSVSHNDCSAVSDGLEFLVTGVEKPGSKLKYSAYPNPTTDFVIISGEDLGAASISMFDVQGRKISLNGLLEKRNSNQVSLDLRKSENGLYLIHIQQRNQIIQLKALKK